MPPKTLYDKLWDGVYYISTTGVDAPGNGTNAHPWRTITYALDNVPDGSTILVKPGDYVGRGRLRGDFALGVTIRSEVPYQARLRNTADKVITTYDGCRGITVEGFDIAHGGSGAVALVVHIDGGGTAQNVQHVTLYNNILYDSYNNDILKINNGAHDITVRGNMFYNQTGSDEHIDVNSVIKVVVEDNVFFNDFADSGRSNGNDTSAYIVIKDSNENDDGILGSKNITVRRNVFLNWQGSTGYGFVQVGEDATRNFEADNVLIENNLDGSSSWPAPKVGNASPDPMKSARQEGSSDAMRTWLPKSMIVFACAIAGLMAGIARAQDAPLTAEISACGFANGASISPCKIAYRAFGTLNAVRDNVVLVPTVILG